MIMMRSAAKRVSLERIMKLKKGDAEKLSQLGQAATDKKVRKLQKLAPYLVV